MARKRKLSTSLEEVQPKETATSVNQEYTEIIAVEEVHTKCYGSVVINGLRRCISDSHRKHDFTYS